ncbi:MAG: hypothetical protein E7463_08460 [Ruminococcaceae bacterium]|nr:hypothetical protein [Oscillospiraceae bacterium]
MSKWIPWPSYYDDAPLDLRGVYDDAPAGKHGFVHIEGEDFVFEDGTKVRFWGTNFNSAACFPEHDYADKVARRLAKIGCNMVRLHQLDAEWLVPNLFCFSKGKRTRGTGTFDPTSLDRLDYLLTALKKEGIYVYVDIFTYRKFKTDDGVASAYDLADAAKPYHYFDRRMIELQKKLACDFWNHVNAYSGLAYKDDPIFVMGEIVNESSLFQMKLEVEPYVSEFRSLYGAWLEKHGITCVDAGTCDVNEDAQPLIDFKEELQEAYYAEMHDYLRSIGVRIPIAGTNLCPSFANGKSQRVCDFLDVHTYLYDWAWKKERRIKSVRMTEVPDPALARLLRVSAKGMPQFVSEWDVPWPNTYRAESPLLFAAVGLLQGWSGYTIHTYSYLAALDRMKILGKESSSGALGGTAFREGVFTTWNDPAKFGLFYHAALMTRRGDVRRADTEIDVRINDLRLDPPSPALHLLAEKCRVNTVYEGRGASQDTAIIPDEGEIRSDTGELYRSWEKGFGTIDTPRTQVCYGLLEKQGKLACSSMEVAAQTDFAVVALSSLTDAPICESDNLLLTTVGRAQNTDARFEGEYMLDFGRPPILAEVIEARITLKTSRRDLHVWAVNAEGMYHGMVPAEYTDEGLVFTVGEQFPSVYYLIQAE